jgi:type III pantothenate kinase
LAIIAAWRQLGRACVVVDAGSAITIDCLDNSGKHLGGYIIPGIGLMRAALVAGTEKIRVDADEYSLLPGLNTAQAVGHGGLLAAVAAVKMAADLLCRQLDVSPAILLTGGDAPLLLATFGEEVIHAPELVFEGLGLVLP